MFIQGTNQVSTPQNKQHIVIHRPLNTVNTATNNHNQKHILVRKSNTSTAQIVPINTSQANQTPAQAGKHTFAYLGTIIKQNKTRDPVVIPTGGETRPLILINFLATLVQNYNLK